MNDNFGLPPIEDKPQAKLEEETAAERIARLRAKAEAQAAKEFDEDAVFAKLLADARDRRTAELSKEAVEFAVDTSALPEEYDVIEIFRGPNKNDLQYVPLGLDGLVLKVPRGVEVVIPRSFVTECLDHAVETLVEPARDGRGNLSGFTIRDAYRFPYRKIRSATKEEYQAFQQSQRALAMQQLGQAA